jgi:hypothetical protein
VRDLDYFQENRSIKENNHGLSKRIDPAVNDRNIRYRMALTANQTAILWTSYHTMSI